MRRSSCKVRRKEYEFGVFVEGGFVVFNSSVVVVGHYQGFAHFSDEVDVVGTNGLGNANTLVGELSRRRLSLLLALGYP